MQTLVAVYIKATSPFVTEAEADELIQNLTNSGYGFASADAALDIPEDFDEITRLQKWAGVKTFNLVCVHRTINFEERDAYLNFIENLYMRNVTVICN